MAETAVSRRRFFRKNLVIPSEHGSWSWLLVPFWVGTAVALRLVEAGSAIFLPVVLTLVGGLSVFLVRQPAAAWLRIRRGRARRADEPLAAAWTIGLALVAGLCLGGLLVLGRTALLWLVIPFALVLLLYLVAARSGRATLRALWTELIGAVGLALMAPAAVIAVTAELSGLAWSLWGLMALQNALGVLYVRRRLADTRGQAASRWLILAGHAAGLAGAVMAGLLGWVPLLTAIPFVLLCIRAAWAASQPRPVANIRRFGFTEVGVEVLCGAWIAVSYWVW